MHSTQLETRTTILFSAAMMRMWIVFGISMVIGVTTALNETSDQCSEIHTMNNFDPSKFAGTWYEIAHTNAVLYLSERKCLRFNFIKTGLSLTKLDLYGIIAVSGARIDWEGKLTPVGGDSSGKFNVMFPEPATVEGTTFQILTTDYDHYAIAWHCEDSSDGISEYVKILSRTATLAPEYQKMVKEYMDKNIASSETSIVKVDQLNCPKP